MTTVQKVIKYCAIALAALLILAIVAGAVKLVVSIIEYDSGLLDKPVELYSGEVESLKSLDISVAAVSLKIERGEKLSVSCNNKYVSCKLENGKLKIEESDHSAVRFGIHETDVGELNITLPEALAIDSASIETGAGVISIANLHAKKIDFEFGAGAVTLSNIEAESTKINGGAGKLTVSSSKLCDLELDMGVGELDLEAAVLGDSKIDCGVGKVELTLVGAPEDYKLDISGGLGDVDVNGLSANGDTYGNGENHIEINGGVGSIDVDFANN